MWRCEGCARSERSLKNGTADSALYFSLRDQVFYLVCPLRFCLGEFHSVSRCLPVTPPPPNQLALFAQLLATFLIQYERLRGVQSSGVLFIFWFLCVLCAIVPFRSKILQASSQVRHSKDVSVVISKPFFFLLILNWIDSLKLGKITFFFLHE